MRRKKHYKLRSAKLWVTIWAMAMVTLIIITKQSDFTPIATILAAAPMVYCGCNVVQKKIEAADDDRPN